MRVLSLFLILAMLLSGAACSQTPANSDDSSADTSDSASDDSADTDAPDTTDNVPAETPEYRKAFDVTAEDGSYTLSFSEPSVVIQGEEGDTAWGHYTFPNLSFSQDGFIIAAWHYGDDDIKYSASAGSRISVNGGKSWMMRTDLDKKQQDLLMSNGKYFTGFSGKGAYRVTFWNQYKHGYFDGSRYLYFAEDFGDLDDAKVYGREYDPETGATTTFECTVNWPYMPLARHSGSLLYPATQVFALSAGNLMMIGEDLYICVYTKGFDSTASSREEAASDVCKYSSVYVFKSADCGRTWDFLSQVAVDENTISTKKNFEGFTEPKMAQMPDGSLVMLLRTGSEHPSYIVRSTDMGLTWTEPVQFDEMGVLPQLLVMPCGVTLSSYGRPELRVRATTDPAGMDWDDPVTLPMAAEEGTAYMKTSCFYTNMLKLSDNKVMLIYTDFNYPNKNGVPVHTVLTRTITITMNKD